MRLILLWGDFDDGPLSAVHAALRSRGFGELVLVDQRRIENTELELSVAERVSGRIRVGDQVHDLADIAGVYLRPYAWSVPEDEPGRHAFRLNEALAGWCEICPALVVNRLSAMASNASKPYQAALIERRGFKTPATLITTSPRAVEAFRRLHGDVVYKSVSGVRSIVSRLTPEKTRNLGDIVWAPTQFQQRVPGRDIRVHVIAGQVFCSEILTDADDYRYAGRAGHDLEIRPCAIPERRREQCIDLARSLGLVAAGIDLRVTGAGDWYCFEVNPSPGFTYYQNHTGQDIAGGIADLLIAGCRTGSADNATTRPGDGQPALAPIATRPVPSGDSRGSCTARIGQRRYAASPARVRLTGS